MDEAMDWTWHIQAHDIQLTAATAPFLRGTDILGLEWTLIVLSCTEGSRVTVNPEDNEQTDRGYNSDMELAKSVNMLIHPGVQSRTKTTFVTSIFYILTSSGKTSQLKWPADRWGLGTRLPGVCHVCEVWINRIEQYGNRAATCMVHASAKIPAV